MSLHWDCVTTDGQKRELYNIGRRHPNSVTSSFFELCVFIYIVVLCGESCVHPSLYIYRATPTHHTHPHIYIYIYECCPSVVLCRARPHTRSRSAPHARSHVDCPTVSFGSLTFRSRALMAAVRTEDELQVSHARGEQSSSSYISAPLPHHHSQRKTTLSDTHHHVTTRVDRLFDQLDVTHDSATSSCWSEDDDRVPVTVLCGFLGAGKTTLVNHVVRSMDTSKRCAVIENEFGEISVDDELLEDRVIIRVATGCACCTGYWKLVDALKQLSEVDLVLVEASGLSSPIAIARALCVDRKLRSRYRVDAVVTLVDAVHFFPESQLDQLLLADRILLNKIDLVTPERVAEIEAMLAGLNETALVVKCQHSRVDPELIVNVRSFSIDRILEDVDPLFLDDASPENPTAPRPYWHDPTMTSVSIRFVGEMNVTMLHAWLRKLLDILPHDDLLRYKGVISVKGMDQKFVIQGVRGCFDGGFDSARTWRPDEPRECKFTFIGRHLNKDHLTRGFMTWSNHPVTLVA